MWIGIKVMDQIFRFYFFSSFSVASSLTDEYAVSAFEYLKYDTALLTLRNKVVAIQMINRYLKLRRFIATNISCTICLTIYWR